MSGPEVVDEESEHIKNTYAHFGLALYLAQCLERGLATVLVALDLADGKCACMADLDNLFDVRFQLTLGKLVRQLSKHVSVNNDLHQVLTNALETRNWLAHNYFWDRSVHFLSREGRELMVVELQEAAEEFREADARLSEIGTGLLRKLDVTEEIIQTAWEELLREARHIE